MHVLVVEDDHTQADSIERALRRNFRDIDMLRISTENQFRDEFSLVRQKPPDLILLDIMLRWAEPAPEMPIPPVDVQREGFYRGGLRCLKMILEAEETRRVPVILYSVIYRDAIRADLEGLPYHVLYVQKGSTETSLVRNFRSILQGAGEIKLEEPSLSQRVWDSLEAKPGWLGFSFDLKKLFGQEGEEGS